MARFVRGAAPSRTAARGPSGCWSRSIVRSTTLASSQHRRNSSRFEHHHDLSPCLEPLSRLPFHGNHSPPENVHRTHSSEGYVTHSTLIAPRTPCPVQQARKVSAAFVTTPCRRYHLDRVLPYELNHRADELIGRKVDVSGELTVDF